MRNCIKYVVNFFTVFPISSRQLLKRWKIGVFAVLSSVLLLCFAYCLLSSMTTQPPQVSIDQQLMHERLFISVRQDSLSQLVNEHGLDYSEPGIFRKRASMGIPADEKLLSELDSLQHHYPDDIEIEDGLLFCHTQKVEGVRYVSVPVIWLIKLRLMSSPAEIKPEDNQHE